MLIFIPLIMLWIYTLADLFRRTDLKGWHTALWVLFIVLLPILGMLVYFIVRPVTEQDLEMQESYREEVEASQAANVADKLHKLAGLRDKGDITQQEFDKQKAKLLKD